MALCLGTAQLGQDYGLSRKPDRDTAYSVLEAAFDGGIEYIDTAPFYGDAQDIIGTFLRANGLRAKICTKIPSYKGDSGQGFVEWCKESAIDSMRRLGRGQLWAVLIHDAQNALAFPQEIMGLRAWFVATGVVQKFGISLYEPADLAHRMMGIYQIPLSMMDTRFYREVDKWDFLWTGNTIMVRSIYLQGKIEDRARAMAFAKKAIADRTRHAVLVIGSETPEQVKENVRLHNGPEMTREEFDAILEASKDNEPELIDPRKWK